MEAKKSRKADAAAEQAVAEIKFSKEQLFAAKRFRERTDLLHALLAGYPDTAAFTLEEMENMMKNYLKGKVN